MQPGQLDACEKFKQITDRKLFPDRSISKTPVFLSALQRHLTVICSYLRGPEAADQTVMLVVN